MGLLDDAIREHLELKRRRGADPAEIERLEREALGPARGGPEATEALLDPGREQVQYEEESPSEWAGNGLAENGDWEYEEAPGDPPEAWPAGETTGASHEPIAADLAAPEYAEAAPGETMLEPELEGELERPNDVAPAPAPAPPRAPPPAPAPRTPEHDVGGETIEYDVEAEHAAEGTEGEELLEETPEFLQDTPDHDRLWFEQRPPKDFDFDG